MVVSYLLKLHDARMSLGRVAAGGGDRQRCRRIVQTIADAGQRHRLRPGAERQHQGIGADRVQRGRLVDWRDRDAERLGERVLAAVGRAAVVRHGDRDHAPCRWRWTPGCS